MPTECLPFDLITRLLFTEVRAAGIPRVRYESNPQIQTLTLQSFCKIHTVVTCKFKSNVL